MEFVYTENRGAAFGILQGRQTFFYVMTIIVILFLVYFVYKTDFTLRNIPMLLVVILIFSGAIGNFIDRVKRQYVIDFIYFKPIDFPVFNMADIYITLGCVFLIVLMLTIYKKD